MRASLYEALGIAPSASDEEVRAALRRLIRKYYAKTRDGQGNVEEALRFINHASRILSDVERRTRYNVELAQTDRGRRATPAVAGDAIAVPGEGTDVAVAAASADGRIALDEAPEEADAKGSRAIHHPGLTEPVASFGRPTIVTIALCVLFGAFIAAAIVIVMPVDSINVAKQVLVWLTLTLLSLTVVYGVVHGLSWARRRGGLPQPALMPQTDLAILNWRREKSVFLGTDQPQEDASWIFQLRMAELERAKAGRTSEPRPWSRLGARLFDYAIWGIVLALLLSELRGARLVPENAAFYLGHPLVAPMLITGTWVAVETLLMASLGTTPGKWLFGCYLQFSISDAYANRSMQSQLLRAFKRSLRVWWEGMGCGFPLLAPILIAIAYERVVENQETDWDFAQDCLATYAPPGILNTLTGVCGLAAMLWLYGVAWHRPLADTLASVGGKVTASLPSAQSLLPTGIGSNIAGIAGEITRLGSSGPAPAPDATPKAPSGAPVDSDLAVLFAERRAKVAVLKIEGPRMLAAGNYRRAVELCTGWADLELNNADAWRCIGQAQAAQGNHQDALLAFRKAKQFDPGDKSLDAAIDRSQKGIVGDFLNRYRK
ncbi:MAG TPA: DnaJ domain-containing protein [Casimicrobiaceae bacterium]|nr:DnaJ domain-containing protein [Casimicrobiaceae bacterium]